MIPFTRFVSALAVAWLVSGNALADVVSLNGYWSVAEGDATAPPTSFAHMVPVPGYLDQAEPAFPGVGYLPQLFELLEETPRTYDWFWYQREFELPEELPSVARLVLHKVAFGAEVWLNGQRIGAHASSYSPGWFDLSNAIRPGENELLVRIGASPKQSSGVSGLEPERLKMLPGIWDDVELHLSGPVYLHEVQVVPLLADSAVRLHAQVLHQGEPVGIIGSLRIREAVSHREIAARNFALRVDGSSVLDLTLPLDDFKAWTPESPFRYVAEIELPGYTQEIPFGMRSFAGRQGEAPGEGRFLLNGEVYYLRGSNVCFGRWTEDPARGSLPWQESWVRAWMRQWKRLNYNSFRATISPLPRLWYRIADEEGMLIQDEYAIWQLDLARISVNQLAEEYRQWMAARWNHPSVVIFDAQNETLHRQKGAVTGEALAKVRDLDLSRRPWDNGWMYPERVGDASERHPYLLSQSPPEGLALLHGIEYAADRTGEFSKGIYLSPQGRVIPGGLNPLMAAEGFEQVMAWSHHPMVVNEFEWLWLSRDGQPIPKRQYETYVGPNSTETDRRRFRAWTNAAVTEFWRTARTSAAVMNFEGLSFPGTIEGRKDLLHHTSDAYLDIQKLVLDPFFAEAIRDANAPTGLMLEFFHREVLAGSSLKAPVKLVNDRTVAAAGKVSLRLHNAEGRLLSAQNQPFSLAALGTGERDFTLDAPAEPGRYVLIAALEIEEGATVHSRREFVVVEREPLAIEVTDAVLGPVSDRLFGHFMELVQSAEEGPEVIADPETGRLPWKVEQAIRSLGPTVLRYPGGYLLELPEFRWTYLIDGAFDHEGPGRPVRTDREGRDFTHHFGLDEFLDLAERLGAEPLLVVKLADILREYSPPEEVVAQAAAMVAYCNGTAGGDLPPELQRWADLRARNGRVEPYGVKLWQIGNEFVWVGVTPLRRQGLDSETIAEGYVDAVEQVAEAMRAVDPSIELIAEVQMEQAGVDVHVVEKLRERLGDAIHYGSTHIYHSWSIDQLEKKGEPVRADAFTAEDYWRAAVSAPGTFTEYGQTILRNRPARVAAEAGLKPVLTEWNWNSWWALDEAVNPGEPPPESLWAKGVAAASILHAIMRSPEPIALATQSMLVGNHWELRSIDVSTGRPIRHPSGMMTGLYRWHHGDQRLGWQPVGDWPRYDQPYQLGNLRPAESVALVDCVVTADTDNYYLHLINRSLDRDFLLQVRLPDEATGSGQLHRLSRTPDEWAARERGQEVAAESSWPLERRPGMHWQVDMPAATVQVAVLPRATPTE